MKFLALCIALCALPAISMAAGTKWALLVAGSNGYYNYRHQSDMCHAYQIFKNAGYAPENIVTMLYDDVANSASNPVKGNLINHADGPNVYEGVVKDYTGSDVTPANFLKVLGGDKDAMKGVGSGKVIESGPDDEVFVAFFDHGAPGLIAFPSEYLYAKDLNKTIGTMHENNQYNKMVLYIEACESGSMFENILPENINVYATTAANAHESSYACYYDSSRQTYLGDLYSVNWMENTDKADVNTETFQEQYDAVKQLTSQSHVMQYGDLSMASAAISQVFDFKAAAHVPFWTSPAPAAEVAANDIAHSRDIVLATLQKRLEHETDAHKIADIKAEIHLEETKRELIDHTFERLAVTLVGEETATHVLYTSEVKLTQHDCLSSSVETFTKECMKLDDYGLKHVATLRNICEAGVPTEYIAEAIKNVCPLH